MLGKAVTWGLLAVGTVSSAYLDVSLAGQPEQLWLPVLNMVGFAAMSGCLFDV
ncbi:MAG: hypothetical protein ACT4OU_09530 [Hyphomicrobium sp.]